MADFTQGSNPQLPPETDRAVTEWMKNHGWSVGPARWELDPDAGFHIWQESQPTGGRPHALWVEDSIARHLSGEQLVDVLDREGVAEEIQFSFKIRIQERGDGYRVSIVSRRSGEQRRLE